MTMKITGRGQESGVALTIVIIILIMLALLGVFVTNLGYNQKRLTDVSSGQRIRLYYNAQAGIINANWRIRTDQTTATATMTAMNPAVPNFSGNPAYTGNYTLNDGTIHALVTIGAVGAAGPGGVPAARPGVRPVTSVGRDS